MSEERVRKDTRAAKETAAKVLGTAPSKGPVEPAKSRRKADRMEADVRKELTGEERR